MVLSAQAQAFFDEGKFFPAAQAFSQCSITFEEVALKFLDVGERDALRSYLVSRLERTQKTVSIVCQLVPRVSRSLGSDSTNDTSNLAGRVLP